jgi:rhodanese-related sulfurtransferase
VLAAARARLRRLSPEDVYEAVSTASAVLVDIRPAAQRALEGSIAGALVVERNALEWRFDPASSTRLPVATGYDVQVIVFCSEGYTSSLAAAALQDLGLRDGHGRWIPGMASYRSANRAAGRRDE